MTTCVIFYLRTDNPSVIEDHLSKNLLDWEWAISIEPTTAQRVHDSHAIKNSSEPNWHTWYSYIPLTETYGPDYPGQNYLKALTALHGVKSVISAVLTTDSTTGDAGELLRGLDLNVFDNGLTPEEMLFAQLTQADREHTEEHGINDINDWDEMLECEVKHFNSQNGTDFDPKEYRIQYCERQEKRAW